MCGYAKLFARISRVMGLTRVTLKDHMLAKKRGLINFDMLRVVHPLSTYN